MFYFIFTPANSQHTINQTGESLWLNLSYLCRTHAQPIEIFEEIKNIHVFHVLTAVRSRLTWFPPLWELVLQWRRGPLLLHRTRPKLPETSQSLLPDDVLKIHPENNQRQTAVSAFYCYHVLICPSSAF